MSAPWAIVVAGLLAYLGAELARTEQERDRWRERAETCVDVAELATAGLGDCAELLGSVIEVPRACSCWIPGGG